MNRNINHICYVACVVMIMITANTHPKMVALAITRHFNYDRMANVWQKDVASHATMNLTKAGTQLEQSECAYYCTSRDNRFE